MIQALLKKWSELEPDRCHCHIDPLSDELAVKIFTNDDRKTCYFRNNHKPSTDAKERLQYALQRSIVAHDARCNVENGKGGAWYVAVCSNDGSSYQQASDEEPAIALLSAYVQWLERSKEVKP